MANLQVGVTEARKDFVKSREGLCEGFAFAKPLFRGSPKGFP